MNVAILGFSIIGAVTGTASLVIMYQTAQKLDAASQKVKTDVDTFKQKTDRNIKRIKSVLNEMEL